MQSLHLIASNPTGVRAYALKFAKHGQMLRTMEPQLIVNCRFDLEFVWRVAGRQFIDR